jgi:hypothetical protein
MKFTDLDASKARNEAVRVDLDGFELKIGDKKISLKGQWVDVYPTDSDEFSSAKTDLQRKAIAGDDYETDDLVASLIAGWSFDDACSATNKKQAIKIWPRKLIDHIDSVASTAINFIVSKPKS